MKFKKLALITLMSCGFLTLGGCAHHNANMGMNGEPGMAGGEQGAETSGAESAEGFGGTGGMSPQQLFHKRTYYFDFNSNVVREADMPAIIANANYLVSHRNARVIVEGHTDPRGSREYNVALGERRAQAVAEILKNRGVARNQIRIVSYGAERLAAPGRTEQDFQLDRRAIIVYQ